MTNTIHSDSLGLALSRTGAAPHPLDQWLESTFTRIKGRGQIILALLKTNDLLGLLQETVAKVKENFPEEVSLELSPDAADPDGVVIHVLTPQQLPQMLASRQSFEHWWLENNYRANWHLGVAARCV